MRMNLGKIMVIGALAAFFCRDAVAQATMGSLDPRAIYADEFRVCRV